MHNNVLIEPFSDEEKGSKTKSGIFIPETVDKEKPDQGKIIVAPAKETVKETYPNVRQKGQKVVFSKYGPDEIKVGEKKYYIISEDSILAVIE